MLRAVAAVIIACYLQLTAADVRPHFSGLQTALNLQKQSAQASVQGKEKAQPRRASCEERDQAHAKLLHRVSELEKLAKSQAVLLSQLQGAESLAPSAEDDLEARVEALDNAFKSRKSTVKRLQKKVKAEAQKPC
mmetsp:Transcript_8087/g.18933  ORF Transcript_8087/g.18933 Transcript_8087/m.18933 type:complete len:135 (+) Transcript_8087:84-488(+)